MLRSRFRSLPGAFNTCLIPEEKDETVKRKGLKATFSRKFELVNMRVFLNISTNYMISWEWKR